MEPMDTQGWLDALSSWKTLSRVVGVHRELFPEPIIVELLQGTWNFILILFRRPCSQEAPSGSKSLLSGQSGRWELESHPPHNCTGPGWGQGSRLFVEIFSFLQKVENNRFADDESLNSGIISKWILLLHLLILLFSLVRNIHVSRMPHLCHFFQSNRHTER